MADEKMYKCSGLDELIQSVKGKPIKLSEEKDAEGNVIEEASDLSIKFATQIALETSSEKSTPFMQRYRRSNISHKIGALEKNAEITLSKAEVKEIKWCAAYRWGDRIMFAIWDKFDPNGDIEFDAADCVEKKDAKKKE